MRTHKVHAINGESVVLATDDTFTLGIKVAGDIEETSTSWLGTTFSERTLKSLAAQYPAHDSARSKIERALEYGRKSR